jgi:hypothetical protein
MKAKVGLKTTFSLACAQKFQNHFFVTLAALKKVIYFNG